jgi:aryl-alcohol dehydrogenase-like predicted oxidoreductase
MHLNDYQTLGRSGLRVSPLCLGTMTFGHEWGWGSSPEDSCRIMDAYIERGGNFLDTANIYTKGHSEKIIGDHLGRHPAKRDRLVIATKFCGGLFPNDPHGGGASRKTIHASLDESLRRLQTDYVDLYWMHFSDPFTPIEETMSALDAVVKAGKVRYIGFSDTPAWRCAQAQTIAHFRGWTPLCALQIEYSMIQRTVEGELVPMAVDQGLGITPWSPLAGGLLSGKYRREDAEKAKAEAAAAGSLEGRRGVWMYDKLTDKNVAIIEACAAVGKERGATIAEVALAWLQRKAGVVSSIFGARTMEQLDANLRSLSVALADADMAKLDEVSKPTLNFPHDFLNFVINTMQNGSTINGRRSEVWNLSPKNDAERF